MKTTLSVLLFLSLCGLNFSLFRKHLHVNRSLSWNEAQKYCREHHYDLSTLTSKEAHQVIKYQDINYWAVWVGLYKIPKSLLEWIWSGGENEPYFWSSDEPNYLDLEDCAGMVTSNSLLLNINCHTHFTFFCMDLFELILVKQNKTWEGALDYCRENYIDLVSITSENITTDVKTNTMTSQTLYVWTGLRFLAGHWFWVNGDEYENGSQNIPLQCPANNLRCAAVDTTLKVLKPQDCEEHLNFFCINMKS
ncbi:hypothetical protein E1301_Tti015614 [Triplophysa tibetana]|uniref:C-type lectin domain-containing protein n=1 Tax=Triplophysa tibetana TaxID=1572043 RepID=A0A5A9PMX9_9TELE|nr:hypothetical protein E1301_Tti015614 [Triplophysa tibetana]